MCVSMRVCLDAGRGKSICLASRGQGGHVEASELSRSSRRRKTQPELEERTETALFNTHKRTQTDMLIHACNLLLHQHRDAVRLTAHLEERQGCILFLSLNQYLCQQRPRKMRRTILKADNERGCFVISVLCVCRSLSVAFLIITSMSGAREIKHSLL